MLDLHEHGLRTSREEIAFTAQPKIQSQSQIFRYGRSIFCLPHRPNFSDVFDLCFHWVSVVRVHEHYFFLSSCNTQWADFGLNRIIFKIFWKFLHDTGCLMLKCEKYRLALTDMFVKSCLKMVLESWDLELFGMYQNHFVICILSFLSSLVHSSGVLA